MDSRFDTVESVLEDVRAGRPTWWNSTTDGERTARRRTRRGGRRGSPEERIIAASHVLCAKSPDAAEQTTRSIENGQQI